LELDYTSFTSKQSKKVKILASMASKTFLKRYIFNRIA
jgi:hypothetical protein